MNPADEASVDRGTALLRAGLRQLAQAGRLAARELHSQRWLIIAIGAYVLAAVAICWSIDRPPRIYLYDEAMTLLFTLLAVGSPSWRAIRCMVSRPERLLWTVWLDLRAYYPRRLLVGLPVFILFPFFLSAFTSIKASIPALSPYAWDPLFIDIDRALHGTDPWRLLQPVLGYPVVTLGFNFVYNAWFFVMWAVLMWQMFSLGPHRLRFLLSFVLTSALLGGAAAIWLSSVGPCFVELMYGDPHFRPLMDYLHAANETMPIWAVTTQAYLWDQYTASELGFGSGISAMPSIHVAYATLLAILGWHTSRLLGVLLTVFTILIMIGSVHLGWHYAIDGYAGAAGAWVIWLVVGRLLGSERRKLALAPGGAE